MILVAGSANLDFVVQASHIPAPGETVLGRDFKTYPGGKGANQAIACARAGDAATQMLLALGNDAFSQPIEAVVARGRRADARGASRRPADRAPHSFASPTTLRMRSLSRPGANNALRAEHLPSLDGCNHLLLQLETPIDTVMAYARAARQRGVTRGAERSARTFATG